MEWQAGCFGGMYLGSVQAGGTFIPGVASIVLQDQYTRGDHPGMVRDHGSPYRVVAVGLPPSPSRGGNR